MASTINALLDYVTNSGNIYPLELSAGNPGVGVHDFKVYQLSWTESCPCSDQHYERWNGMEKNF